MADAEKAQADAGLAAVKAAEAVSIDVIVSCPPVSGLQPFCLVSL